MHQYKGERIRGLIVTFKSEPNRLDNMWMPNYGFVLTECRLAVKISISHRRSAIIHKHKLINVYDNDELMRAKKVCDDAMELYVKLHEKLQDERQKVQQQIMNLAEKG